jgi:predicted protein tyrosine phosphatase
MVEGWPRRIISLVGHELRYELPIVGQHHFMARFHDLEVHTEGYVAPNIEDMRSALEHAAGLRDEDRLLIHCHAGKSRSPAMALAVLVDAGLSPQHAMAEARKRRPFVIPNRLMVRMLDQLIGQEGGLIRVMDEHYATLPSGALLPNRGGLNI